MAEESAIRAGKKGGVQVDESSRKCPSTDSVAVGASEANRTTIRSSMLLTAITDLLPFRFALADVLVPSCSFQRQINPLV